MTDKERELLELDGVTEETLENFKGNRGRR